MKTSAELVHALDTNPNSTEPAVWSGITGTALASVWVLINAFWPKLLTTEQENAINGFIVVFLPIILALVIRQKVWSPKSVNRVVEEVQDRTVRNLSEKKQTLARNETPPKLI